MPAILALTVFDAFVVYGNGLTEVSQDLVEISHKYHRISCIKGYFRGEGFDLPVRW